MTAYRLDHIALLVRDLDETADFLTRVLRIAEIANPMGGSHIRWFEIGDGRRFHVQAGDIARVHVEKQTHIALSTTDFDGTLDHLRTIGQPFGDMKGEPGAVNVRPDGMRAVFVVDPNGYWFEINDASAP